MAVLPFGGFSFNGAKWDRGEGGRWRRDPTGLGCIEILQGARDNEIEKRFVRNASVVFRLFLIGCERDLSLKVEVKRNLMNSHRKLLAPV